MLANIFISYSTEHRDLTRDLAAAIETHYGEGSVWWDQAGLRSGDRFSPEITRALDDAKAVVVVWTEGAVASDWVYAEAVRAAAQRKVVTVRATDLDPSLIPLPFSVFHTCLVHDTRAVLDAIAKRLGGEASPLPSAMPGQGFRTFLLDPKQEALPIRAMVTRPASLLLAKHRSVPFDDIHGIRDAFVRWATEMPPNAIGRTALGRIVHAPAGVGKTRALIEIADELTRSHGWLAGFVPRDIRGTGRELSEGALERLILGGRDAAGLMLIIDYAENRHEDVLWLADQLVRRAETVPKPTRLVLVSRGAGVWWRELVLKSQSLQELFSLGGEAFDEATIPVELTQRDRLSMFHASVAAFRAHRNALLGPSVEIQAPSDDLINAIETEDDYKRPLAVQIAALLHVAGVNADKGPSRMASLLDKILGLEYEHWDKALNLHAQSNLPTAVKNGVAQVTLAGAIDKVEAVEALIGRDPLYSNARDIDAPRVSGALASILPGGSEGLVGLEPDLIGEHHVVNVATDALVDACLDWACDNRVQRQHVLTILNRATRAEHGSKASRAEAQLARLVRTRAAQLGADLVKVALETPGQLLELCAALESQVETLGDPPLAAIEEALPQQSLALMELSLSVATRRADLAEKAAVAKASPIAVGSDTNDLAASVVAFDHWAGRLDSLGRRLSDLGRHEEALARTETAVAIRRFFAQTLPAFEPQLAATLVNVGARLAGLGRHAEALAATQEAADVYRRLAQTADAFLPELAVSLHNVGQGLSKLDRYEEALAASHEALDLHRRLAQTEPEAFLPRVAASLDSVGMQLNGLERYEEALAATQEGVDIRKRLARTRPDTFLPDFGMSLHNLGLVHSNLRRNEEALAATQQAADIFRCLAQTRPDTFLPDLARNLSGLGANLWSLERRDEALAATQESADLYRRLARTLPDVFLPDLATNLNKLGGYLLILGRGEEALTATQESIDLYRRLAQTRPDAFLPDLARSLGMMSNALAAVGQDREAARTATEALEIVAPFIERHPQAYETLGRAIADYYRRHSEGAHAPDTALPELVARVLEHIEADRGS
jgi:tetratricopeptide (TPR) repeat protein